MHPLLQAALGSILRWALTFLAGFFVEHGIWSQDEASAYIAGAVVAILTLAWSLWQKYHSRIKFLTALQSPAGTSEATVDAKINTGTGAKLVSVLAVFVLGGMLTGCAPSVRHIATVTAVGAHATLSAVQDTEMALACGKPSAPAPPACVPADLHREISAQLVTAFDADIRAHELIRDWPATGSAPNIATFLAEITSAINFVLQHLPSGPALNRLLVQIGGVR